MYKSSTFFRTLVLFLVAGLCSFGGGNCLAQAHDALSRSNPRATLGAIYLSSDTVNFGIVNFGTSKTLVDTLLNIGATDLIITNISATNPVEFSVIGNLRPRTIFAGGSGDVYTITFTPKVKVPGGLHVGYLTFTYDGGQTRTVTLIGHEHTILSADLRIDTGYYGEAGSDVVVHQFLISDLSGTVLPVTDLQESILFDPAILSLTSVSKGSCVSAANWTLTTLTPAAGQIQIELKSSNTGLGGPGILCDLHFHVSPNAQVGETSSLPEIGVTFGGGVEPTISVLPGEFHVSGNCGPIALSVGNIATSAAQNSPNPFSSITTVHYWINEAATLTHVRILLYDQLGNLVRIVLENDEPSGNYAAHIDSRGLESGVYSYSFEAGTVRTLKRMMVIK